jgi:hypothetical protein
VVTSGAAPSVSVPYFAVIVGVFPSSPSEPDEPAGPSGPRGPSSPAGRLNSKFVTPSIFEIVIEADSKLSTYPKVAVAFSVSMRLPFSDKVPSKLKFFAIFFIRH